MTISEILSNLEKDEKKYFYLKDRNLITEDTVTVLSNDNASTTLNIVLPSTINGTELDNNNFTYYIDYLDGKGRPGISSSVDRVISKIEDSNGTSYDASYITVSGDTITIPEGTGTGNVISSNEFEITSAGSLPVGKYTVQYKETTNSSDAAAIVKSNTKNTNYAEEEMIAEVSDDYPNINSDIGYYVNSNKELEVSIETYTPTEGDKIKYCLIKWSLKRSITENPGTVKFSVRIEDNDGFVWHTEPASFSIKDNLNEYYHLKDEIEENYVIKNREIVPVGDFSAVLVKGDSNSNKLFYKMNRYFQGQDMLERMVTTDGSPIFRIKKYNNENEYYAYKENKYYSLETEFYLNEMVINFAGDVVPTTNPFVIRNDKMYELVKEVTDSEQPEGLKNYTVHYQFKDCYITRSSILPRPYSFKCKSRLIRIYDDADATKIVTINPGSGYFREGGIILNKLSDGTYDQYLPISGATSSPYWENKGNIKGIDYITKDFEYEWSNEIGTSLSNLHVVNWCGYNGNIISIDMKASAMVTSKEVTLTDTKDLKPVFNRMIRFVFSSPNKDYGDYNMGEVEYINDSENYFIFSWTPNYQVTRSQGDVSYNIEFYVNSIKHMIDSNGNTIQNKSYSWSTLPSTIKVEDNEAATATVNYIPNWVSYVENYFQNDFNDFLNIDLAEQYQEEIASIEKTIGTNLTRISASLVEDSTVTDINSNVVSREFTFEEFSSNVTIKSGGEQELPTATIGPDTIEMKLVTNTIRIYTCAASMTKTDSTTVTMYLYFNAYDGTLVGYYEGSNQEGTTIISALNSAVDETIGRINSQIYDSPATHSFQTEGTLETQFNDTISKFNEDSATLQSDLNSRVINAASLMSLGLDDLKVNLTLKSKLDSGATTHTISFLDSTVTINEEDYYYEIVNSYTEGTDTYTDGPYLRLYTKDESDTKTYAESIKIEKSGTASSTATEYCEIYSIGQVVDSEINNAESNLEVYISDQISKQESALETSLNDKVTETLSPYTDGTNGAIYQAALSQLINLSNTDDITAVYNDYVTNLKTNGSSNVSAQLNGDTLIITLNQ